MKAAFVQLFALGAVLVSTSVSFAARHEKSLPGSKLAMTVSVDGEQAATLMGKIVESPWVGYEVNTPVVTQVRLRNITCRLVGSHAAAAAELGETYTCGIEL